jgi:integrase
LIAEGRRNAANPVVGLIHNAPTKRRQPRPLKSEELALMWQILCERGNALTRFAAAAGEESGLRIGEICNLRVSDVDPFQQRFFVRLPNKRNCERWAYFSEKTKRYYVEWMPFLN